MLVIFAPLELHPDDRNMIENYRQKHDPQHQFVGAHFTLVFPCEVSDAQEIIAHVQNVAASSRAISFHLTQARAVRDHFSTLSHVFLMPGEDTAKISLLHDRLYSGPLARYLHPNIVYEPHVTVGAFSAYNDAVAAAESLGAVSISGQLRTIEIAHFDGKALRVLQPITLG